MQKEIIGHKKIIDYFKLIYKDGKLASSYLFIGKEGIGKRKVARFIATLVNCRSSSPPCFRCSDCLSISKAKAPDVIELSPVNSLGIDEIRDLQRKIYLKNFSLTYKVVIIDKAEKLTSSASDAFLKVLEEPPPNTLMILITSQPQIISSTIKSRVQKIYFRLSFDEIRNFLDARTFKNQSSILWSIFEGSLSLVKNRELFLKRERLLESPFYNFRENERTSLKDSTFLLIYFLRDSLFFRAGYPDKIINSDLQTKIKEYAGRFSLRELLAKIKELLMVYQSLDNININLANNLIRTILS